MHLRYGENPHQAAAYYARDKPARLRLDAQQLGGKQLSYNNILDVDAAWRAVSSFDEPTAVIVKHLNPTGIASDDTLAAAFPAALASDPLSAFGGIIALNRTGRCRAGGRAGHAVYRGSDRAGLHRRGD